jgi:hypothetical protein
MALTSAKITVTVDATIANAANALAPISIPFRYTHTLSLAAGTAINQANRIFLRSDTVDTGTPDDIDFSATTFLDPSGDAATMAKVVAIIVVNKSTTAGQVLTVGGDAAPIAEFFGAGPDVLRVGPGGIEVLTNPSLAAYAVTATTADILQVGVEAGTAVAYDIIAIGRSA